MLNNPVRRCLRRNYYGLRRGLTHIRNAASDRSPKLLILAYHRIKESAGADPLNTVVTAGSFVKQLEGLSRSVSFITLADAASQIRKGTVKGGLQAVVSFDDGYHDNFETAFPILKKRGLPAAFFVPTYYMGKDSPVWDHEVIMRILYGKQHDIEVEGYAAAGKRTESAGAFAFRVFDDLKSRDMAVIERVTGFLREMTPGYDLKDERCVSWEEVRRLSDSGMEIGSHAVTHRSLARIPSAEADSEIVNSKAAIEKETGRRCADFAFPFGSARDYNDGLIERARSAGYDTCLLNIHGYNHMKEGAFALKRIIMDEHIDTRFILG